MTLADYRQETNGSGKTYSTIGANRKGFVGSNYEQWFGRLEKACLMKGPINGLPRQGSMTLRKLPSR
jgi:hypothetical protein